MRARFGLAAVVLVATAVALTGGGPIMAPVGIEPTHGASKAPALSSELRGRAGKA